MPEYRAQSLGKFPKPYIAGDPVRKVVTKRKKRVTGWISSTKMDGLVPYESFIERDQIYRFEVDNAVRAYFAQPEVLVYPFNGSPRKYYPDFRVDYWTGETHIVEVKSEEDANDPENMEVFDVLKRVYAGQGRTFRVSTDKEIRHKYALPNATALLEFRDRKPSPEFAQRVDEVFHLRSPRTVGELEAFLGLDRADRGILYGMAARGHFSIAIDEMKLCADSPVYRCNPNGAR